MVLLPLLVTISLQEAKLMEVTEVMVVTSQLLQIHRLTILITLGTNTRGQMEPMAARTDVMAIGAPILHIQFRLVL